MIRYLLVLICLYPALLFASGFSNEKRSEYIVTIAKYVTWPSGSVKDTFTVGLLVKDNADANDLVAYISANRIKELNTKVLVFSSVNDIVPVDLLYFNQKDSINALDIYNNVNCQKTLIVTENYPFQKSMFNFIVVNDRRKFELNAMRLQERGFSVDPLFSAMAIRNKADWEQLYQQTEHELAKERKTVVQQKTIISTQHNEITSQKEKIVLQKTTIAEQTDHIEEQSTKIAGQQVALSRLKNEVHQVDRELQEKIQEIDKRKELIIAQKKEAIKVEQKTLEQKALLKSLEYQVQAQSETMLQQLDAIERQRLIIGLFAVLSLLVAISAFQLFRAFQIKKKSNKALQEKNDQITAQNEEICQQRDQITLQKEEITDSIQYASKIQAAMLSSHSIIADTGADFFVFYRPRDIVSGDFYWFARRDNYLYVAAADCTGHGVPGAFMSMLGLTFLSDIVGHSEVADCGTILFELRRSIVEALNKKSDSSRKDGMDMGLCRIDMQTNTLQFAGAYNHCFVVRDKTLTVLQASKMPVGLSDMMEDNFEDQNYQLQKGDTLYLYSDGYPDQFGGPKGKKFMSKRFKELLASNSDLPMADQENVLSQAIYHWMADEEQIDDMLVLGICIPEWKFGSHI